MPPKWHRQRERAKTTRASPVVLILIFHRSNALDSLDEPVFCANLNHDARESPSLQALDSVFAYIYIEALQQLTP